MTEPDLDQVFERLTQDLAAPVPEVAGIVRRGKRRRTRRHALAGATGAAALAGVVVAGLAVTGGPTSTVTVPANSPTPTAQPSTVPSDTPTPSSARPQPTATGVPNNAVAPSVRPSPRTTASSPAPTTSTPASAAPTAVPAHLPTATFGHWTGVKPSLIYFSGDSGNIVGDISWTSWDQQSAFGQGTWGYNDCKPDCADGKVIQYPATVTLSHPSGGQFTLATEVQGGPHGTTLTFALPDPSLGALS